MASAVEVIAHRGASGSVMENTIDAFEKAVDVSADWIEMDVRILRDGTLAVFHDASLKRLAGIRTRIEGLSIRELAAVSTESGLKIPTLDAVFEKFAERVPLIVEIKTRYAGKGRMLPQKLLDMVDRFGVGDNVVISSFQLPVLLDLRKRSTWVRLGLLFHHGLPGHILRQADDLSVHSIHVHRSAVRRRWIERAQKKGFKIYVYTVDREEEMRYFKDLGVDGIFTNFPGRLRRILDSETGV